MLLSVSENNVKKIEDAIKLCNFEYVFLVDYASNLAPFLKFLTDHNPHVRKVFCYVEQEPDPIKDSSRWQRSTKPWSIAEYHKFLTRNRVDFEGHHPVYDQDVSRLPGWRNQYACGPFYRISRHLHALTSNRAALMAADFVLGSCGMALQLLIPPLRKQKGTITFSYRNTEVCVLFDDSPGRDHYGENPLLTQKLAAFEAQILSLPPDAKTGFFIASGPRHEYMGKIFDLEDARKLKNIAVLVSGLYRPRAFKIVDRRKTGFFSKGNNVSIGNETVYSDHCLAIGAGEKELWCYLSANGIDLQK